MPGVEPLVWRIGGGRSLACGERTLVMGVVNVTPDSFSDGGRFLDRDAAVEQGLRLAEDGADLLDVGGESTRPGAASISAEEEIDRVVPVIERLIASADVPVSVDTRKGAVASAALAAGATIVNDVSGGRDPSLLTAAAGAGAGLVLMHMLGEPGTMQEDPRYDDVVAEVRSYLASQARTAEAAGVAPDAIAVDPGLGFGKTYEHNLTLMMSIGGFQELGRPVVVGPSRKSFIGRALGDLPVDERLEGTAGAVAFLAANGAHVVRVHDVKEMVRVVRVVDAIRGAAS
jgi:dihydropteroate synthase